MFTQWLYNYRIRHNYFLVIAIPIWCNWNAILAHWVRMYRTNVLNVLHCWLSVATVNNYGEETEALFQNWKGNLQLLYWWVPHYDWLSSLYICIITINRPAQPSCLDVNWLWLFGVTSCVASNIRSCFANLLIAPAAWIFYMVILYVVLLLLVALIVSMVFSDSTKAAVLGIIYSLLWEWNVDD